MKISFNWLKEYIPIPERPETVAQLLTQSGIEVSSITTFSPMSERLQGLVIGQVVSCEQHPHADRLKITLVEIGQHTPLRIVCGAPNVDTGQKVIVAPVGTQLYHPTGTWKIKKAKIRGELSEGMLCAEDEVGLGNAHEGIMVLDTPLVPGTPFTQYLNETPDYIFEIDLTPNRSDAYAHLGTARELGVVLDRPVQYPSVTAFKSHVQDHLPIQVAVHNPSACPRYAGMTIRGIRIQPSPSWLRDKLKAIGIKPINNVVDVTNFVLHELGQPLHAFDYDQIVGKHITVQTLEKGTPFTTLEGNVIHLDGTELMVCDQAGGICLAGIIGGQRASIHPDTQHIFLESAYFTPDVIRKAAKQQAITTQTSFRYERGTDPNLTVYALKRACMLLQEIAQGQPASSLMDHYPQPIENFNVKVTYQHITKLLGFRIPKTTIRIILNKLGINIQHETEENFIASIPPYRVDVRREVDIIEEVARIYGYDRIPVTGKLSSTYLAPTTQPSQHALQHEIEGLLAANGYHEIYTNSLTSWSHAHLTKMPNAKQPIAISNPMRETLDTLRTSLLFSGLEVVAHNINRQQPHLKLFEFGKIYYKTHQHHTENKKLGIWLTGNIEAINWVNEPREVAFQDLHGILHKVLHKLHITSFSTQPFQDPFYQLGIQITVDQTQLLTAGKVHESLLISMGIHQPVFFSDVNWEALLALYRPYNTYQPISKFPPATRDISLVLHKSIDFEAVRNVIAQYNHPLIKSVTVFDVYHGDQLPRDHKAYALRFALQEQEKTLDEKTIEQLMTHLIHTFEMQLGAHIRVGHAE